MEKLHVTVGFVFTQVMFCDGHGKLHFHRVMTDVDKPWKSVKEVLGLVKNALGVLLLMAVQVEFQYKQIHFSSLLASLREQLVSYLTNGCQLTIQVFDVVEEPENMEEVEEVCEEIQVKDPQALVVQEMGQAIPSNKWRMYPIYREADAVLIIMEGSNDQKVGVWDRKESQPLNFFVEENGVDVATEFDQRGSPGYLIE